MIPDAMTPAVSTVRPGRLWFLSSLFWPRLRDLSISWTVSKDVTPDSSFWSRCRQPRFQRLFPVATGVLCLRINTNF